MKTVDFLNEHSTCHEDAEWALSVPSNMSAVWDAMVDQGKHEWLMWIATRPGVFPEPTLRRLACRFVRETPLHDERTVWNLLEDERGRKAVEVAERYADGTATEAELSAAYAAACAVADAASDAACAAAWAAAACAAAWAAYGAACASARFASDSATYAASAACAAAWAAAAKSAQVQMISELGNPFKEESESC